MVTHFFTSITANFLPKARVLSESIRKFHPAATIHVVLCDAVPAWFAIESEPFQHILTLHDLGLPNLTSWLFQHDLVELCTAVKGFALQLLLAREDCDQVIYLDPDILVLAPFDGLLKNFENASILLTTHQSEPETTYETVRDNELLTLQHGIFNLGFLGVRNSPVGRRFAQWWTDRLRDFCFDDIPIGLFVDQRWPDLVPSFFPDHKILRDPVYNVSGWNLTQRRVEGSLEHGFTVNGQPLVFFHFSGIDSGREWMMLQRYGSDMPALTELRDWYLAECDRHGDAILASIPWAYGFFANGDPILRSQRVQYRRHLPLQERFPDPFHFFPAQAAPVAPADELEQPVRPCRIFLIAAPADEQYIDETLSVLKSTTVQHDQLWLVTRSLTRDIQSIAVDALRYEDFAAHVLQNFADKDIILIRAGALTPPQWDLRLAWTAARHPSALTISPLDRRTLDEASLFAQTEPDQLDARCYFYRQKDELEIAFPSQDCVYIASAGVRDLTSNRKQLRLSNLADDAARHRWQHLQATHLCLSFNCPLNTTLTPEQDAFLQLRNALRNHSDAHGFYVPRRITSALTLATLHISHSWGGGVEQWVRNFAQADTDHEQLVLKSIGPKGTFGRQLELHRYGQDGLELLQTWTLSPVIRATALAHTGYREILAEITTSFSVGRVIVSSLIGHSLDCLRTQFPTIFICHDYYPFCSAINLSFGEVCRSCEEPRLAACLEENPLNQHFPNVARSEWLALRAEFLKALQQNGVNLIGPSPSVQANYVRLVPELESSFQVIRHGLPHFACETNKSTPSPDRRFQILVLGNLIPHKGVFLLDSMLNDILSFADLTLAGCLDSGSRFFENPKIRVIPEYKPEDLPRLIAEIQPDVGLFLSVWPETFSYTLHELQSLCVPPVATNLGGYLDAIEEGVTGFLCEPEPLSFLHRLHHLAANPSELAQVRSNLAHMDRRSIPAMVEDYAALTPDTYSAERYFSGPHAPDTLPDQALQVYWPGPDGAFSEVRSFSLAPFHPDKQTAYLYIPALRKVGAKLRFDPGSKPGLMHIDRMTLFQKTGEILWASDDCLTLLATASHARVFPLSKTVLCIIGDDPQIELSLSEEAGVELARSGGYLAVDFAWHPLESHILELLSVPAALSEELTRTLGQFEKSQAMLADSQTALDTARATLVESRLELEKSQAMLAESNAALQNSQAALENKDEQIKRRTHELEMTRKHSESLAAVQQSLLNSHSWQLTKPLRAATELSRKLIRRP